MSKVFEQNVDLDAQLVLAAAYGGIDNVLLMALARGCKSTDEAIARTKWLKKQSQEYVNQVAVRAVELGA